MYKNVLRSRTKMYHFVHFKNQFLLWCNLVSVTLSFLERAVLVEQAKKNVYCTNKGKERKTKLGRGQRQKRKNTFLEEFSDSEERKQVHTQVIRDKKKVDMYVLVCFCLWGGGGTIKYLKTYIYFFPG